MIVFQQIVLALNVLSALVFGIDCLVIDNPKVKPKVKARMGVLLAVLFLAFLISLTLLSVFNALLRRNPLYLALLVYVLIPFVIGRLASYRTLRFYSSLQLLAFLLSAVTLCLV